TSRDIGTYAPVVRGCTSDSATAHTITSRRQKTTDANVSKGSPSPTSPVAFTHCSGIALITATTDAAATFSRIRPGERRAAAAPKPAGATKITSTSRPTFAAPINLCPRTVTHPPARAMVRAMLIAATRIDDSLAPSRADTGVTVINRYRQAHPHIPSGN